MQHFKNENGLYLSVGISIQVQKADDSEWALAGMVKLPRLVDDGLDWVSHVAVGTLKRWGQAGRQNEAEGKRMTTRGKLGCVAALAWPWPQSVYSC